MRRILAIFFGIIFIFIGMAGFLPSFLPNGYLFGYFEVNLWHKLIYIISGVLAIMAATSLYYAQLYFKILGIIYLLLALLGFWHNDLYLIHVNFADNILHLVIAILALILGFKNKRIKPYQ